MPTSRRISGQDTSILRGLNVVVLTSGHEALDSRVYGREALSLQQLGATVTVVAKLTLGVPGSVDVKRIRPERSRIERFLLQPWRCLLAARKLRPDIVHLHDAEMLAILPVARLWWPKAKFVYDVHEDFANLMLIRDWIPGSLKPLVRALTAACERSLAYLADGIVAVTPPLASKFPHRYKVGALNFPTPEFFDLGGKAGRPAALRAYDLVHLGTLSRPRAAFLAEVIGELNRRRPDVRSLVFGTTQDMIGFLKNRVPESCELRAEVAHAEVPAILANAKVGIDVHPWLQPHLRPALAVKICEYMACGSAVVASSMPVLDEILSRVTPRPPGITTIPGGEARNYADAVLHLLGAIDRGEDPGGDLRRFALENMNWQSEANRIGSLYRSLVDGIQCAT